MQILGITGGIATGKSTVTHLLAELGAPSLSADVLARNLLVPGAVVTQAVLDAFPESREPQDLLGQTIDRRALSRLVFADADARHRLEGLTHPPIIAALAAQASAWRILAHPCAGALEIPLLFETSLQSLIDQVIVVACSEAVQVARLRARLGIDEAEARRQIAAQWPLARKIAAADTVLTTDGGMDDTRRQVLALWQSCCNKENSTHA